MKRNLKIVLLLVLALFTGLGLYSYWVNSVYQFEIVNNEVNIIESRIEGNQTIEVPKHIYWFKVTSIEESAFENNESIEVLVLPESIRRIGFAAFAGCINLKNVNLSDNIVYIGNSAFANCDSLEAIHIPIGIDTIPGRAFMGCDQLSFEAIEFHDNIHTFGETAFNGTNNFINIKVPESVKHIGSTCFSMGFEIISVDLPEGLETIGKKCFINCPKLVRVYIPDTVYEIGEDAFDQELLGGQVVLEVIEDSYAHQYAIDNAYEYRLVNREN